MNVTIELSREEAKLLRDSIRDIQKALAWEHEDDVLLSSIADKCRKALRS